MRFVKVEKTLDINGYTFYYLFYGAVILTAEVQVVKTFEEMYTDEKEAMSRFRTLVGDAK
jgi:hypothetical protein